ncbi:DUF739 family protein [Pelotomaculum terephthalicicum JT]|uniref:DUF739 family protein n=1 Tax=Pelotomaculum terephthalicicum TaxID=206393 RepID=UPI001F0355D3|nr:DUF739 family protein [Pelotomaculum terephthalicicum]MCG9969948.1 DUF739 family protein [Pelotomaculum terephthalicicum JT]
MFIIFNHKKLEERINEKYGNQDAFAKAMGMSKEKMNSRLKSATDFTQPEINKACELLDIPPVEIPVYFFDVEYQG